MKILVLFYSMYGHTWQMAEAAAEGARQVEGADVQIRKVKELVPREFLESSGAAEKQKQFAHIPEITLDEIADYDGFIFGTPSRYGNMCAQMREFLDQLGPLFAKNTFVGKVGSVFASANNQHGGLETTIISFHFTLLHLGMVIVGLPYTFEGQKLMTEITGGSPYGASTMAGHNNERYPSKNDLDGARFQGRLVAELTGKIVGK